MPMPRMTNTFMLGGESDPRELIASVDSGLYAVSFGGGQVDITNGKFVFSASEAYLIEDGKLTRPVKGASLIGNGPDVLTRITMVGNDLALDTGVGTKGNVMALDPQLVQDLLRTARQRGASAGDALLVDNESFEVQVRLGEVEKVQQSHQKRLGLRLFFGQRCATTSTSDLSEASLRQLLDDTCALAQAMAADPQAGLPDPQETITTIPDLALWDDAIAQLPVEERTAMAREAERAALDYDSRITNSEGGEYSSSQSHVLYANSHGFVGHYQAGTVGLSVSPIAAEAGGMQSDYWFATGRKLSQLQAPAAIGQEAARRALRRLGARKVATQRVPVVFDPSTAASLLGHVCSAVSGSALYRGASFLPNCLGTRIAPETVTIYDDGTLPGALGSKPFDG